MRELKRLLGRLEALEQDIRREEHRRLQRQIDDHFDAHDHLKRDRALLESIPGIGRVLSASMTATLRSRAFRSARQAAAFHGLVPVQRRPRLAKAGSSRLRRKLCMAAVTAAHHNADVRAQYQRLLQRGKAKMAAIGAAMRKLLHIAFGVLKSQQPYQPRCSTG
nr:MULTISPECIES: IS110 family transposase [unclassified Thioalkalivibrio]